MNNYNVEKVQQYKQPKEIEYTTPVIEQISNPKEIEKAPIKAVNVVEVEEPKVELIQEEPIVVNKNKEVPMNIEVEKHNIIENQIENSIDIFGGYTISSSGFQV